MKTRTAEMILYGLIALVAGVFIAMIIDGTRMAVHDEHQCEKLGGVMVRGVCVDKAVVIDVKSNQR